LFEFWGTKRIHSLKFDGGGSTIKEKKLTEKDSLETSFWRDYKTGPERELGCLSGNTAGGLQGLETCEKKGKRRTRVPDKNEKKELEDLRLQIPTWKTTQPSRTFEETIESDGSGDWEASPAHLKTQGLDEKKKRSPSRPRDRGNELKTFFDFFGGQVTRRKRSHVRKKR